MANRRSALNKHAHFLFRNGLHGDVQKAFCVQEVDLDFFPRKKEQLLSVVGRWYVDIRS